VRFDRSLDDRESEPGAVRLRRPERFEDPLEVARRDARAGIRDVQVRAAVRATDLEVEPPGSAVRGKRVDRILDQVHQDLADLLAIAACVHRLAARVGDLESARAKAIAEAIHRRADELAELDRLDPELVPSRQPEQVGDLPFARSSSSRMTRAASASSPVSRSASSCCARLRAAVTGLRISWTTRAANSPITASFSA
jgi:hypothetical protein